MKTNATNTINVRNDTILLAAISAVGVSESHPEKVWVVLAGEYLTYPCGSIRESNALLKRIKTAWLKFLAARYSPRKFIIGKRHKLNRIERRRLSDANLDNLMGAAFSKTRKASTRK